MAEVSSAGFPHSDIPGSLDICSFPGLFAAYHVFLRLLVPRHPPCALLCITFSSGKVFPFPVLHVLACTCLQRVFFFRLFPSNVFLSSMSLLYLRFVSDFLYAVFKVHVLFPNFFLFLLAATCSPIPSPVQYHRPARSSLSCSGWVRVFPRAASPPAIVIQSSDSPR